MEKSEIISKINSARVNLKANWIIRIFNHKDTVDLLDEVIDNMDSLYDEEELNDEIRVLDEINN